MDQAVETPEPVKPEPARRARPSPAANPPALANHQDETIAPADDALNWSRAAFDLELESIARQLALNSIVASWQDDQLVLAHLPELEVLVKPEIVDQIRQAISSRLGVSLTLELRSQPQLPVETPHQARQRELAAERTAAIQAIRRDPVVRKLQSAFGAELDESSVTKLSDKEVVQ